MESPVSEGRTASVALALLALRMPSFHPRRRRAYQREVLNTELEQTNLSICAASRRHKSLGQVSNLIYQPGQLQS